MGVYCVYCPCESSCALAYLTLNSHPSSLVLDSLSSITPQSSPFACQPSHFAYLSLPLAPLPSYHAFYAPLSATVVPPPSLHVPFVPQSLPPCPSALLFGFTPFHTAPFASHSSLFGLYPSTLTLSPQSALLHHNIPCLNYYPLPLSPSLYPLVFTHLPPLHYPTALPLCPSSVTFDPYSFAHESSKLPLSYHPFGLTALPLCLSVLLFASQP